MITQAIDLFVVDASDRTDLYKTIGSEWSWSPSAPLEVRVQFNGDRVWRFAREIVIDGVEQPAGLADVKLWPSGEAHHRLRLETDEGFAVLEMEREPLEYFAKAISSVVPQQREIGDDEIRRYIDEWSSR